MPFGNDTPFPLSDAFISRFRPSRGFEQDFLKARASRSRSFETFDFNIKALDTTNQWTVAAGATATTWAVLAQPGGWIRGVTGASVATGALQLSIPTRYFNGTLGSGFASLIQVSAETEVRIEQGFADVLPAVGTTVVNSLASATFNSVTTGAVYVYDQTGSTTTTGLYCLGASTTGNRVATTTNRYASGSTLFVALEVIGRNAMLWLGDTNTPVAVATNGTNAADAWIPFINVKTSSGSKNVDVDCIWTWTNGRL